MGYTNLILKKFGINEERNVSIARINESIPLPIIGKKYFSPKDGKLMQVKVRAVFLDKDEYSTIPIYVLDWADGTTTLFYKKICVCSNLPLFETIQDYKDHLIDKKNGNTYFPYVKIMPLIIDAGFEIMTDYSSNSYIKGYLVDKVSLTIKEHKVTNAFVGLDKDGIFVDMINKPDNFYWHKEDALAQINKFDTILFDDEKDTSTEKDYVVQVDLKIKAKSYEDAANIAKNVHITTTCEN